MVRVETETSRKIKIVRCNNGSEYKELANELSPVLGILFKFTTSYTSY
jgi:hypothetical protein